MDTFIDLLDKTKEFFAVQQQLYGDQIFTNISAERLSFLSSERAFPAMMDLSNRVRDCQKCPLAKTRKQVVFGGGDVNSDILLIGEAPGYYEDQAGEVFVGEAGQLLDKILAAVELDRKQIYITNVVKCRPPKNRDPEPHERAACFPILRKQMEILKPKYILALGRIAAHVLLNTTRPLSNLRNRVYRKYGALMVVTYHPAALLRNQKLKRDTWGDVQVFQKCFSEKYRGEVIDLDKH
ncbi:MAG: uracil-DNA glycosylase [Calditrichaeota bacterium]|nr:uracil-DNA glycosylase [Calditrichota bacterium]